MPDAKKGSLDRSELQNIVAKAMSDVASAGAPISSAHDFDADAVAKSIDHTLLKPDATDDQIREVCREARHFGFASVCVHPTWVTLCHELLAGTDVKTCTVIGFPLGATLSTVKAFEAKKSIDAGAQELDMVLNVGRLRSGDYETVYNDIVDVVAVAHPNQIIVKVIIETSLLSQEEKVAACALAQAADADFVKTSTGFSGGGATVEDIQLMRRVVGPKMGVKASGGVRTAGDARQMLAAGATRIGASSGVAIMQGLGVDLPAMGMVEEQSKGMGDSY